MAKKKRKKPPSWQSVAIAANLNRRARERLKKKKKPEPKLVVTVDDFMRDPSLIWRRDRR